MGAPVKERIDVEGGIELVLAVPERPVPNGVRAG